MSGGDGNGNDNDASERTAQPPPFTGSQAMFR